MTKNTEIIWNEGLTGAYIIRLKIPRFLEIGWEYPKTILKIIEKFPRLPDKAENTKNSRKH